MYYFNLLPYFFFRPLCWSSSVCYNVYPHFPEFKIPLSLKSSINEWCHKIQRKYVTLRYLICYIRYSENFDKWNWSFSSGIYPDKHKVKVRVFFLSKHCNYRFSSSNISWKIVWYGLPDTRPICVFVATKM